ncbi:hypothetical protein [Nocardia altamirensis]|uniref:hypothetical protein n=1 Tax=Nocardia altamirensis TaxID=472158 RepID=UPI00084060AC|nr:hypothetical protein [Nocardia altamirensis]
MSNPNPNPDEHGEEITGLTAEQRQAEIDALNNTHATDLTGTAAAKLAARFEPVVPDGGRVGRAITPHVARATTIRNTVRMWAPAVLATLTFAVTAMVVDLPGPLAVYGAAIVGYAWWMCAGRPGPIDTIRMCCYRAADGARLVKRHVTRLAVRRGAYEARRTNIRAASK